MNSKTTGIWLVIAIVLLAFIFIYERHWDKPAKVSENILPGLQPADVTGVQIIPAGALEIRADRANGHWLLSKPIVYPAQATAVETLLDALQKLAPANKISAAELRQHKGSEAEYGFENPPISLVINAGDQSWQLKIGNKTAPGDQFFLRVVGVDGAFIVDAGLLKLIPLAVNDWRDTSVADASQIENCDWITLTNNAKGFSMEFQRNPTNHFWRMIRPLPARADNDRITEALQQLQSARVAQFVADSPQTDLSAFGLQPADLDLWLGHGTNVDAGLHLGKNLTNDSTQIYAKRERWSAVVATAKEPFSSWRGSVYDFRDPHLLELSAPVDEIDVRGENNFTLQREGTNGWKVVGEKFPADAENVQAFVKLLTDFRVVEFVKDVVTTPDLQTYGLATPSRTITLSSASGNTNVVIGQLLFGATQTNEVFVRRADEDFVYAISKENYNQLPEAGWEFRDRHIWSFTERDVTQITLQQNGKTRVLLHNGYNKWSLGPGSQGMITPEAIEETTHRLGELTATAWAGRNVTNTAPYGFKPDNLQVTVELKDGEKFSVNFGAPISDQTALASVMLDGERWVFIFPPALYQFVVTYLTIPANVP
ncbi:MAG TPA: DUF4340 domain-containing protein [Verrucomicrobiae bacterium]|nr:DUF4340 domain-containing protein [Verrucomicrobiae bacterium]